MNRRLKAPSAGSTMRGSGRLAPLAAFVLVASVLLGAVQATASAPVVTTGSATAITETAAILHGSLDPTGVETTECRFEWGTTTSYGNSAPCAEGNAFNEPKDVSAELTGLTSATTYHYRLVAVNADGESQGEDRSFSTDAPPSLESDIFGVERIFVTEVSARAATLNADLNPGGAATTWHFEYAEQSAHEASGFSTATKVPVPDAQMDAGTATLTVSAALTGLNPGTRYVYRLLAENSVGSLIGPERKFRTDPIPAPFVPGPFPGQGFLPDNRAWEMVSPPDKNGGGLRASEPRTVVSPDGEAVGYVASSSFAGVKGTGAAGDADYIARRGPGGWITHGTTPAPAPGLSQLLVGTTKPLFSENVTSALYTAYDLPEASDDISDGVTNLYRVNAEGSGLRTLTSPFDPNLTNPQIDLFAQSIPIGGDRDFERIYFSSAQQLLPSAAPFTRNVYEWDRGTLRLAGILPDGSDGSLPPAGSGAAWTDDWTDPSANLDTVSDDGSRALFKAAPESLGTQLYMRRDGTDTVWVTEAEGSSPVADPQGVLYEAATPDLHTVAFTTASQLTDEDPGGPGRALYLYTDSPDPEGEENLEFISRKNEPAVVGISADGSRGYFMESLDRLFRWDEDGVHVAIDAVAEGNQLRPITNNLHRPRSNVRISADGTRIAFVQGRDVGQLTDSEIGRGKEGLFLALYVYDSDTDELVCASCLPSGAATTNDTRIWPSAIEDEGVKWSIDGARFLSANGRYAFFSSPDALVPEDINGRYDAYEFDIDTGEPHLLSSGRSPQHSWFASASASGNDAFFITHEALSAHDVDDAKDMYDARVGGGLPEPPPPPVGCEGDACQPPPLQLNDPTPASSSFAGAGDAKARKGRKARRCPKGKRRVKARSGKARCAKKRANRKRGGAK